MNSKSRCLVFGGGGFIGSHLCEHLIGKGHDVVLFDKLNFSQKNILHIKDRLTIIEGDFNNKIDIQNSLNGIDHVFHLVSSTLPASSNDNPVYDAETNLLSSIRLFTECANRKIKKLVFLSSGGTVYGVPENIPVRERDLSNPICSYGIIKKTIEEYLFLFKKIAGLNYDVFRLSNPYGERQNPLAAQGAVAVFIHKAINDDIITIWGNGEVVRDYIYIGDAVKVLADSISVDSSERIFNLSSGTGHSLNDIIRIIENTAGKKVRVEYKESRSIDVPVNILDNTLVSKTFNWKPETGIEEGIKKTYNFLKKAND